MTNKICEQCKTPVSDKVADFSIKAFKKVLCYDCQGEEKSKLANIEKEQPTKAPQSTKSNIPMPADERRRLRGMCISYAKDLVCEGKINSPAIEIVAEGMFSFICR